MREQDDDLGQELAGEAAGIVPSQPNDDEIWTPLRKMRHSAAHVMAEAVLRSFPGCQTRYRPAHRGRFLLRLRPAPPAHA